VQRLAALSVGLSVVSSVATKQRSVELEKEKQKAKKKAAKQFQKDWKSKKRKQVAAERSARASVEQANLQSQQAKALSSDAVLASMMDTAPPVTSSRGKTQLDKFEDLNFG
jgi:hypothetical protein